MDDIFNMDSNPPDTVPKGDATRQAVDSLRGYAYQIVSATLAWIDIEDNARLFLEVAEDYATIAQQALQAVQVKDTERSGSITLNNANVRDAVASFVDLVSRNPGIQVELRYFTTSDIRPEQSIDDRPAGKAGLMYWREVARGADPTPIRKILESGKFKESVNEFCKARDDDALRRDLFKRIHWDCGKPDFSSLKQELEKRLIVFCRDRFNIAASEARRLSNHLIYIVLMNSIGKTMNERVLNRADLYTAIDGATQLSVPRASIDRLIQNNSNIERSLYGSQDLNNKISVREVSWIINGDDLPSPRGMISRNVLEAKVHNVLLNFGICFIVGGSGLGKTHISRAVAGVRGDSFSLVDFRDFRDNDANGSRLRLNMVFAHIGGLKSNLLILEDLNQLDDMHIVSSLGRVVEALKRRDRSLIISCYRKPSVRVLAYIGLDQNCFVECPYFSEEETHTLVNSNGGDPDIWGHLAYLAGACGHPQLTHAFVFGMAARKWPDEERYKVVINGFSTYDIEEAQYEARRNLIFNLPEGARSTLYRISLINGRFTRSLALAIGDIPPQIPRSGECLDQLVGPWIETVGKDLYRVSPLARSFGREMLPMDEKIRIHGAIAVQMLCNHTIESSEFDSILLHAITGKSISTLVRLAQSILSSEPSMIELLAEQLILLPLFKTDSLIFPEHPLVSVMLRNAQFKLAAVGGRDNISEIVGALLNEINGIPECASRSAFEMVCLYNVLGTKGIANDLYNWFSLLQRLKSIVESEQIPQGLWANIKSAIDSVGDNFYGTIFSIGSADLASVERLECIVNELDKCDESDRALWLKPIDRNFSDYSILINGPWASQERRDDFNAADTVLSYQRISYKVKRWGIRPLTAQCWVAQAVLLDEYENKKDEALAVLDKGEESLGYDQIIARERAKIFLHANEHMKALEILRRIIDQFDDRDVVDRVFILRDAAISAAKCNEWQQSEKWFLAAQSATKFGEGFDMQVMAIGLCSDAAVAAVHIGNVGQALLRFAEALKALVKINPEASLRSAFCHRIVRHAISWTKSYIEKGNVKIGGEPISIQPGTCSNPNPPAIQEVALKSIYLTWYILAQIEAVACIDVGISEMLGEQLIDGTIIIMEHELRLITMQKDIDRLDTIGFSKHFKAYIESAVYILQSDFDLLAPQKEPIPVLSFKVPFDTITEPIAVDTIQTFIIRAGLSEQFEAIKNLKDSMEAEFSGHFPGRAVFENWENNPTTSLEPLDKFIIDTIKTISQKSYISPLSFWIVGLRLFEKIDQSLFRKKLILYIAAWLRAGWKKIITTETYNLFMPSQAVPAIRDVLENHIDDRSFIAKLLLVTSETVGAQLDLSYRERLKAVANE